LSKLAFQNPKIHQPSTHNSSQKLFVYVDFPKGESLRETATPIHKDWTGTRCIDDEEIRSLLKGALGDKLPVIPI
jgi:hypothetical protein